MIEITIIAALLHDVQKTHGSVFNTQALRLTVEKVKRRVSAEGLGFLTKTLPRLGKAFDKALSENVTLSATSIGFDPIPGSKLPRFLGELIAQVLKPDGSLLPEPCVECVKAIRQISYCFYKYELPYSNEQEQKVLRQFERTEEDIQVFVQSHGRGALRDMDRCYTTRQGSNLFAYWRKTDNHARGEGENPFPRALEDREPRWLYSSRQESMGTPFIRAEPTHDDQVCRINGYRAHDIGVVSRAARQLLTRLFEHFDPRDIIPRHGPGAVATKQKLWHKYEWTNVSSNITTVYPYDEFFNASIGHVCDSYRDFSTVSDRDLPARVVLVPKDSRGPRLISCEPVDYQWVQQGLMSRIVDLVEKHPLTKGNVFFTDQTPNQRGALIGSKTGRYATLDLNEASDRVSLYLVRLLFPEHVLTCLESCRSSSTEFPDGRVIRLNKFAPMGSGLCFPVLALTVWAILTAGAPDAYTGSRILVYGDDVIVPTAQAANAIEQLESFGLKVNRDKSCTGGFFRESCGTDAFRGINVTPVRFRTVWSSHPSADVYTSWISYANSLYDRRYYATYDLVVGELIRIYGCIPSQDMNLSCPALREVPDGFKPRRRRWNKSLQKLEYRVRDIKAKTVTKEISGWSMLLRFFVERGHQPVSPVSKPVEGGWLPYGCYLPFSVREYTPRDTSVLVFRWR